MSIININNGTHCGRPGSSIQVLECSFHAVYKWVVANVSMTRGKFEGKIIIVFGNREQYKVSKNLHKGIRIILFIL